MKLLGLKNCYGTALLLDLLKNGLGIGLGSPRRRESRGENLAANILVVVAFDRERCLSGVLAAVGEGDKFRRRCGICDTLRVKELRGEKLSSLAETSAEISKRRQAHPLLSSSV